MAAGIIQTAAYKAVKGTPEGKKEVHKELTEGLEVLIKNDVDLIICEVQHSCRMITGLTHLFSIFTT